MIRSQHFTLIWPPLTALILLGGCAWQETRPTPGKQNLDHYVDAATNIDYPDVELDCDDCYAQLASMPRPTTLAGGEPVEFWDLELEEAVHAALMNSQVLRDLGGLVLRAPDAVNTIHNPAIQETDPRFGVESALSAFDAQWSTRAFVEKNDRAINNRFLGGGTRLFRQDLFSYRSEITKRSAIGTQTTARHVVEYDFNNAPANATPNLPWLTHFDVEVRQPILQGGGVDFNRIAGPGTEPGVYRGVMIARINTDISLADFEADVIDFVSDVETAYWELYFAYRDLDAKIAARDRALQTWRRVQALAVTGRRGGDSARESRAREQYYRLEGEVQNALSGQTQERSRVIALRGTGGIYGNERRLRRMIGATINDGRLIRPSTEPTMSSVRYSWEEILAEALTRRVELRRQQWRIKRRELELIAAKHRNLPQLDVFGGYRWRGLGHDLIEPNGTGRPPFNDAFQNLTDGNFQEWRMGVEFAMPVGLRQTSVGVRNAELNLHRDRALLDEQMQEVALDISNAIAEKDRAYLLAKTNLNRRYAAEQQLSATEALYEAADENQKAYLLDLLLDAQRRLADANSRYYRSLAEHMVAIKQVHFAKGSLLDYNEIYLAEGPWPEKAYDDAMERDRLRMKSWRLDNFVIHSPSVSRGAYSQGEPAYMSEAAGEPAPLGEPTPLGEPAFLDEPAHVIEPLADPSPQFEPLPPAIDE